MSDKMKRKKREERDKESELSPVKEMTSQTNSGTLAFKIRVFLL